MKTSRLVRKFSCWPTLTCKAILPYSFNPLETFRHIFQISWFTISKPQTVTFFPINKFIRAYPFFKIFFRRRLFSNKNLRDQQQRKEPFPQNAFLPNGPTAPGWRRRRHARHRRCCCPRRGPYHRPRCLPSCRLPADCCRGP